MMDRVDSVDAIAYGCDSVDPIRPGRQALDDMDRVDSVDATRQDLDDVDRVNSVDATRPER